MMSWMGNWECAEQSCLIVYDQMHKASLSNLKRRDDLVAIVLQSDLDDAERLITELSIKTIMCEVPIRGPSRNLNFGSEG